MADRRFAGLPMVIETRKSAGAGDPRTLVLDPLDARNLDTLRRLRATPQTYNPGAETSEVTVCVRR